MRERKRESRADGAKSSAAPSKRSYSVRIDHELLRELRRWPKPDRKRVGDIIRRVQEIFGQPHLHSGIGIRDLSPSRRKLHLYTSVVSVGHYAWFSPLNGHRFFTSICSAHMTRSRNSSNHFFRTTAPSRNSAYPDQLRTLRSLIAKEFK